MIYLDLEANGLTPDTIWCVVTKENDVTLVHKDPESLSEALRGSQSVVGHNLIGYDVPVLGHHSLLWEGPIHFGFITFM